MSQYELKLIDRRPSARDLKIFQRKILSEGYCIWRKARSLRLRIYGPPFIFRKDLRLAPFLSLAFAFYHLAFYKRASALLLQNNMFCTAPSRRIADL